MSIPEWFQAAVDVPRQSHTAEVSGARIHYQTWPCHAAAPGLLFVHGHGANSHWWDFVAPALRQDFNVVAMDMSGAGDSDHRDHYAASLFASEIATVAGLTARDTIVVGHSFGGSMARIAAWLHPDAIQSLVLVDSSITTSRGNRKPPPAPDPGIRYYASLAAAKKRFRLRPAQPCHNDYILDYIATHSVKAGARGYSFKLDQSLFSRMHQEPNLVLPDALDMTRQISCPVGLIYGELSRFFPPEAVEVARSVIAQDRLACIEDAHHHLFLEQPIAFIDSLKLVLSRLTATPPVSTEDA